MTTISLLGRLAPLGPLAMAGWALSVPYQLSEEPRTWIPRAAAESGRLQVAFVMLLLFAMTATAGAIVTGLVARRASLGIGTTGLVLTVTGFGAVSFSGAGYDAAAVAAHRVGAPAERVLAELDTFAAPMIAGAVFVPLMALGVILMGVALWRGRAVPRWAAALLIAAFPVILVGGAFSTIVNAAGWLLMAVGFWAAGEAFVRQSARYPVAPSGM